jgi:hypothetical protein
MLRILINIVVIALVCGCSRPGGYEDYRPWAAAAMGIHGNEDISVPPPVDDPPPVEITPPPLVDEVVPCPPVEDLEAGSLRRPRRKIIKKIFRRRR